MRRKSVMLSVITIIILFLIWIFNFNIGYSIAITNNTNKIIKELNLKYKSGEEIVNIPVIKGKEVWKGKIKTDKVNGENQIILQYKDNKGTLYEYIIVPYLERGYSGKIKVFIKDVDKEGGLKLNI